MSVIVQTSATAINAASSVTAQANLGPGLWALHDLRLQTCCDKSMRAENAPSLRAGGV